MKITKSKSTNPVAHCFIERYFDKDQGDGWWDATADNKVCGDPSEGDGQSYITIHVRKIGKDYETAIVERSDGDGEAIHVTLSFKNRITRIKPE